MSEERIKEHKKDLIDMKKAFRSVVLHTIPVLILTPIILNVYFGISIFYSALLLSLTGVLGIIILYNMIKTYERISKQYETFSKLLPKKPKIDISKKWK